jgi:hypothetical protein
MPLPSPFTTPPLTNLLTALSALGDDEARRRDALRSDLATCLKDNQNPDSINRAAALRSIITGWNTLDIVVNELKEAWFLKHGLPAHVALAHSFAACVVGMGKWRKEMAGRIGRIVESRIIEGKHTADWQRAIDDEDRLTAQVEHFDHLLFKIKGSLEMFGNNPSVLTFNRALNDILDLGSTFPWLNP